MALLLALLRCGHPVVACHVDHGTRPGSEAEGRRVAEWCRGLGAEALTTTCKADGASEAALRDARYAALMGACDAHRLGTLATGHTADDQAETVVMRLQRGAGVKGLAGIPPERALAEGMRVVRPLLGARRGALREWLAAEGVPWLEDPSNQDPRYLRNRMRASGLPLDVPTLCEVATTAARAASLIAEAADEARGRARRDDGAHDLEVLRPLPEGVRREALVRALGATGLGRVHILALDRLAADRNGTAEVHLPGGLTARREYDRISARATARPASAAPFDLAVPGPGELALPAGGIRLTFSVVPRLQAELPVVGGAEALFDAAAVGFPLTVRSRRPGDRMRPFGAPGRRKLQDVLTDARVPEALRSGLPLVVRGDEVLWIPGVARGHVAPLVRATTEVLRIRLQSP